MGNAMTAPQRSYRPSCRPLAACARHAGAYGVPGASRTHAPSVQQPGGRRSVAILVNCVP
jgi:hypothetical protein